MPPPHEPDSGPPIFKAVSSSARQLFQLLNCIRFASKAHVQISPEGLRFAVEESRVMQGIVFLDKALFTTFSCVLLSQDDVSDADHASSQNVSIPPTFQLSLSSLLETLQIFGAADITSSKPISTTGSYRSNIRLGQTAQSAFSNQSLGLPGVCRLSYQSVGSPFTVIIEESGVTTTCNLNTYVADGDNEGLEEIPFQREATQVKIIMQSRHLFDAISELSSTTPTQLTISAFPTSPYLSLSSTGHLGSATVEFSKGRDLLETFTVSVPPPSSSQDSSLADEDIDNTGGRWSQSYKFDMIKAAAEAMRLASKVSIRGDEQGVLSLQFMVEVEGGGVQFVDYRFVPYVRGDADKDEESGDETEEEEDRDGNE